MAIVNSLPCPRCNGIGWLRRDVSLEDPQFGKLIPCECQEATIEDRIRKTGLPRQMQQLTFAAMRQGDPVFQEAMESALQLARGRASYTWLILLGPPGTGKTHLACAVLLERACSSQYGGQGYFTEVVTLLRQLRDSFSMESGEGVVYRDELRERVMAASLLVLDDLGVRSTEWVDEILYEILNHRWSRQLETVITMNRPLSQLEPRIADRLASVRSGFSKVFTFKSASWR